MKRFLQKVQGTLYKILNNDLQEIDSLEQTKIRKFPHSIAYTTSLKTL